jgi:hypothetical protein
MKTTIKFLSLVLLLSVFIMLVSYGNQKDEWKGTIEKENGVTIIKNPREPLYGEIEFELEEDLIIGKEDDENYMFYKGIWVEADSDGNIFVLDRGNFRIQKYDKNGNYLQTIGRQGQGPSEFERPSLLYLDDVNNIYVQDLRKMHVFDKSGKFKRTFTLFDFLFLFGVTKEGNILAPINSRINPLKGTEEIVLVSSEGIKIKTIASYPWENPPPLRGNLYLANPYSPVLCFCPLNDEAGVYGYSSEYKLFVIDSSGELVYIIEKEEPGESFTRKEKNKLIDEWVKIFKRNKKRPEYSKSEIEKFIKFPKYKSFYSGIIKDDKERIYIIRYKLPIYKDKIAELDLFNREGYYLYRIRMPVYPRIIKNGYVYRWESDQETGYRKVKRYKIKNWDQIKEGI